MEPQALLPSKKAVSRAKLVAAVAGIYAVSFADAPFSRRVAPSTRPVHGHAAAGIADAAA